MSAHLVTGAGSGIGAVVARRLHDRGDALVLLARSEDRAAELRSAYDGADVQVADLSWPESVESLVLPDELDSVVHAAGVVELGPVAELMEQRTLEAVYGCGWRQAGGAWLAD